MDDEFGAEGGGTRPAPTHRSDLVRWVASVTARPKREPLPSVAPWTTSHGHTNDAREVSFARELRVARGFVRKATMKEAPAGVDARRIGDGDEVMCHVVAYALDASADLEAMKRLRAAAAVNDDDDDGLVSSMGSSSSSSSVGERGLLSAGAAAVLPAGHAPFLSTRADVGNGGGVPARFFVDGEAAAATPRHGEASEAAPREAERRGVYDVDEARAAGGNGSAVTPGDVAVRGLELALGTMRVGERALVRVAPEYAFLHSNAHARSLASPPGVDVEDVLFVDVEVLAAYPVKAIAVDPVGNAREVHARLRGGEVVGESGGVMPPPPPWRAGRASRVTKRVVSEGRGWETPRPPFDVTIKVAARAAPAAWLSGAAELESAPGVEWFPESTISYQSGDGSLPLELAAAVNTMRVGEASTVWCEAGPHLLGDDLHTSRHGLPSPPDAVTLDGIVYTVQLLAMTHVRDVFGDGLVFKRREREGTGEFPADCPIHDCRVRVHFTAGLVRKTTAHGAGQGNRWGARADVVYDTRAEGEAGSPFEFNLGCGALPEALETSIRLMVPGEMARVTLVDLHHTRYGYEGVKSVAKRRVPGCAAVAKAALAVEDAKEVGVGLEWLVELTGFDRPVNWHKADLHEMLAEAEAGKSEGNALLAAGDLKNARAKYEKVFHNLDGLRGLEPDEFDAVSALKRAVLLNLAAVLQRSGEHALAEARLAKVLVEDPNDVKALWRRSVSKLATHEYTAAREDLRRVAELDPSLARDVDGQMKRVRVQEEANLGKEIREMGGILLHQKEKK